MLGCINGMKKETGFKGKVFEVKNMKKKFTKVC